MKTPPNNRTRNGSLCAVLISLFLLAVVIVGAIAIDTYRYVCIKHELHNATDAGALAGAQELWTDLNLAEQDAYDVTKLNQADGRSVDNASPGTSVKVTVVGPSVQSEGSVTVQASMSINHLIAPIFGRTSDVVSTTSIAGSTGSLITVFGNQLFPLAVSSNARTNGNAGILETAKLGDKFQLNLNSQGFKNAAFTTLTVPPAKQPLVDKMIKQALGLEPEVPGLVPSISVGDDIYLNNGILSEVDLARGPKLQAMIDPDRPPLILPVIEGEPPFNRTHTVVGFIAFKPTDVTLGRGGGIVETITGTLVKVGIDGSSETVIGKEYSGNKTLASLTPTPIKLIR